MGGAFKETPQLSTFTIPSHPNAGARRDDDSVLQSVAVNVHLTEKTETSGMMSSSVLELESRSKITPETV